MTTKTPGEWEVIFLLVSFLSLPPQIAGDNLRSGTAQKCQRTHNQTPAGLPSLIEGRASREVVLSYARERRFFTPRLPPRIETSQEAIELIR